MMPWQTDEALVELIDLYFRLSPAPTDANVSMKTWLAREIGEMAGREISDRPRAAVVSSREGAGQGSASRTFKPSDWMEPRDVADYLKVNVKTLANWRSLKMGPAFAKYGRVLYRKADIDAWRESRLHRPEPGAE